MRALYFFLYFTLMYALRLFYKTFKVLNKPKKRLGRTIYVSNHAASFMDPLVVATQSRPIVFFMTRADVFTPVMKPILWAAHMLPIYRQQDGVDTKQKNQKVFEKCSKILKHGRNLLIFGEGFTDDVFVRRLKPLKKGAVRIGFTTLENLNWKKKIHVATIGINYGDPNVLGSEVIISNGISICLNDYKEAYYQNDQKVVNQITELLEKDLQNQLTHVEEYDWAFFHEHVMRITRQGIDPFDKDTSIPLLQRWENSKSFAKWINQQNLEDEKLLQLKEKLADYFQTLKNLGIHDKEVYESAENKQYLFRKKAQLILSLPLILLGLLHFYMPYKYVHNFVEKTFKRSVFWSSVKVTVGMALSGLWNIPIVVLLNYFVFTPLLGDWTDNVWAISVAYYLLIPFIGRYTYACWRIYKNVLFHQNNQTVLSSLVEKRTALLKEVSKIIKK